MSHPPRPEGPSGPRPGGPTGPGGGDPKPKPKQFDDLLTVDQAARLMKTHKQSIYRLLWDKELPWLNVGRGTHRPRIRIRASALAEYIDSRQAA